MLKPKGQRAGEPASSAQDSDGTSQAQEPSQAAVSGRGREAAQSRGGDVSRARSRDAQLHKLAALDDEELAESGGRSVDDLWSLDIGSFPEGGVGQGGGVPDEAAQQRQWGAGLIKKYSPEQYRRLFPNRG